MSHADVDEVAADDAHFAADEVFLVGDGAGKINWPIVAVGGEQLGDGQGDIAFVAVFGRVDDKEAITVTINDAVPVVKIGDFGKVNLAIADFGDGDDWVHG